MGAISTEADWQCNNNRLRMQGSRKIWAVTMVFKELIRLLTSFKWEGTKTTTTTHMGSQPSCCLHIPICVQSPHGHWHRKADELKYGAEKSGETDRIQ